ncbi:uncharacterized protein LOC118278852 [Spodoptera frugiperda]|uniref:Uncharacterized protein LOC118278852 n=1 Tax=Spodoptera frugiperda TaxID=7108 RepID=A0A9R0DHV6_SPOFR|nr:uncharacterized protein LOC118278852 [Spodoptera frugiperda]
MFKMFVVLCLMFVVSGVWSSCDSCGRECSASCGTRRFRACCFNYLRRKRAPHAVQVHQLIENVKSQENSDFPVFLIEDAPLSERLISNVLPSEYQPYTTDNLVENQLD